MTSYLGLSPTCASWFRCAGLVGCHGYPPLTFRQAPWVSWDGGEGGCLSPRPLRRTDWRRTGSRSQRAPTRNLRGDESKQTPGHAESTGSQHIPRSAEAAASTVKALRACVPLERPPPSAAGQTPHEDCVPMRGCAEASFPLTLFALCWLGASPPRIMMMPRYHRGTTSTEGG